MRAAVLAALLLAAAAAANEGSGEGEARDEEPDVDDEGEGDVAPFMIVVEHPDGWRCSGSLVSLRSALTTAWCVRGRGEPARELWALAAAAAAAAAPRAHAARRVARLAVAASADAELADPGDAGAGSWRGVAMDLALVELEEPFGQAAGAQPILMSTTGEECAWRPDAAQCHVSRAVPRAGSRAARLRVVTADLAPPDACAAAADHWSPVRDRALCLRGPELCESDWGGGVVCGGKLCGVLSRSVRAAGAEGAARRDADDACGDTHAAQSVARWRRFLHCAHTLRACGRGGDCADLCVERRLIEEPEPEPPAARPTSAEPAAARALDEFADVTVDAGTSEPPPHTRAPSPPRKTTLINTQYPTRTNGAHATSKAPARTAASATAEPAAPPLALRPAFEFEPNRADFKAAPTRSTRVYLKAGEYGDNAADYGGEEAGPPAPTTPAADAPTRSDARADASVARVNGTVTHVDVSVARVDAPPAERRRAPLARPPPPASRASRPTSMLLLILIPFACLYND